MLIITWYLSSNRKNYRAFFFDLYALFYSPSHIFKTLLRSATQMLIHTLLDLVYGHRKISNKENKKK